MGSKYFLPIFSNKLSIPIPDKIQFQYFSQNKNNTVGVNNNQISSNYFGNIEFNNLKIQNEKNNIIANNNSQFYNINEINNPIEKDNKSQNIQIEGNNKGNLSNNLFTNTNLTDDEVIKCKENGFILIGKT